MSQQGQPSASGRWIVATDLDGTLLDHETYGFEPAKPALELLMRRRIPLVIVTSKTWSEVRELRQSLAVEGATVVENGSALVLSAGTDGNPEGLPEGFGPFADGARKLLAPSYAAVLETIHRPREEEGFDFTGFDDLSAEEVADICGFSVAEAERAKDRWCSEPLEWQDSAEAFRRFTDRIERSGLRLLRGGRFHHVVGDVDKGRALRLLREVLDPGDRCHLVALGDGPNDRELLEVADVAVVVPNPHSREPLSREAGWIEAPAPGPAGWNESLLQILGGESGR